MTQFCWGFVRLLLQTVQVLIQNLLFDHLPWITSLPNLSREDILWTFSISVKCVHRLHEVENVTCCMLLCWWNLIKFLSMNKNGKIREHPEMERIPWWFRKQHGNLNQQKVLHYLLSKKGEKRISGKFPLGNAFPTMKWKYDKSRIFISGLMSVREQMRVSVSRLSSAKEWTSM